MKRPPISRKPSKMRSISADAMVTETGILLQRAMRKQRINSPACSGSTSFANCPTKIAPTDDHDVTGDTGRSTRVQRQPCTTNTSTSATAAMVTHRQSSSRISSQSSVQLTPFTHHNRHATETTKVTTMSTREVCFDCVAGGGIKFKNHDN